MKGWQIVCYVKMYARKHC